MQYARLLNRITGTRFTLFCGTASESSSMVEPTAIGLKIGVEVLNKLAPTGLAWLKTKVFGKDLLAIGERRAGKSSFIKYLEYGVLLPAGTKTPRTLEVKDTASFQIVIGRNETLRMSVRRATDTRGHDSSIEQARLVGRRHPAILMIFLDASRSWQNDDDDRGIKYLKELLDELNVRAATSKRIKRNLMHMCVILNKVDLLDKRQVSSKTKQVKKLLSSYATPHWGPRGNDIAVYPCISIEHKEAVRMLDGIIKQVVVSVVVK